MDLYKATFIGSILMNTLAVYQSHRSQQTKLSQTIHQEKADDRGREQSDRESVQRLKWRFFPIYLLVNAADWLQGPYIYPIYKDEKGLPEETVAFLFLIGFVSAGISASFAGTFADRHGRKTACLAYCTIYSFSSMTLLSDDIYVLFFGRILGGISGTLLWSVFESWLVAEFNKLMLEETEAPLAAIFSMMTTSNTCVAIAAGLIAEWLVRVAGTAKAPFMLSIGCLAMAFVTISKYWGENYGAAHDDTSEGAALLQEEGEPRRLPTGTLRTILRDRNILVLALTSCFFEGSLFLFIFFKFPALKLSHKLSGSTDELPFGLIFAILMCSMMFGSLLYKSISTSINPWSSQRILTGVLVLASVCFFVPGHIRDERLTLWCFCIFELCCGAYYPVMASLKGKLIDDGLRASVYGMLRVPLNVFVVLALSTTKEGETHRDLVFTTCSALLLVAAIVVHKVLT
ncbi:hypothetical protein FB567DRAFT_512382 [Paraphoma chrysanthemicola]|uniref:Molybdate-anion transporter n=1 Tax=Paraphoma chrysanthemicola TaxID=798071 RepID=A0A8K0RHA5_9PLEO|nr:hypothetical protein FB567DRAFT_512382 [Paraphoma chrysanthemicola]